MSNPIKTIFSARRGRAWAITSIAVLGIFGTATGVCNSRLLSGVLDMVLGGDRAITASGSSTEFTFELSDGIRVGHKEDTMAQSDDVAIRTCEEGMVLLKNKNNTALPARTDTVKNISVFGKNSVNMVYAGSGSAGNAASGTVKDVYDSLNEVGYTVNPTLLNFYKKDGSQRTPNPGMDNNGGPKNLEIGETPVSSYSQTVKDSFADYSDMAIIFLSRIGGEGFDLPREQPQDSSKTFLDLYQDERDMINLVKASNFKKIVVIINAANQMNCAELDADEEIDAILWAGFPGAKGSLAIGRILTGAVNPSGHLVDTYVKDFKYIPSYFNFGNNGVDDGSRFTVDGTAKRYYFVDYEEDIYVGYRYFETGFAEQGQAWYDQRVLYPFGHGLSYTTFDWNINTTPLDGQEITKEKFTVSVEVTNTGAVAGKEVVQLYVEAPYKANGIEKSSKVLVGFGKTGLLEANGGKETLEIEVDPYYLASYDAKDKNSNGFKGYEIEAGSYKLHVAKTAHDDSHPINMVVKNDIKFENDPVTNFKVENQFEDIDVHLQQEDILTRDTAFTKDLTSLTPTAEDRAISDDMFQELKDTKWIDPKNPLINKTDVEMPKWGVKGNLKLESMIGKDFNDPAWEALLDQVDVGEAVALYGFAGFKTLDVSSVSKPKTVDADGPVGLTNFMGDPTVYKTVMFQCEVITASTWNVKLAEEMGKAVGDEGIMGNVQGDKLPYTGWYAPGLNLHRNPFGGRCCEYFSEDPFLSGKMGANEVKGANSKGMITYMKHFVGNEGETFRDTNGCASYMTEQSLRELYLRTFEICVKEGQAKGCMTSFNRVGNYWTGASYALCTTVLRNEWGFHGSIVTDFNTHFEGSAGYMKLKPMLYAGGNLNLCSQPPEYDTLFDRKSAVEMTLLRNSTHEVLYAVANSNAMANEILGYKPAYWKIGLYSFDAVLVAGSIGWGCAALIPLFKKKRI